MSNTAGSSVYSSANASTSTLRPRTNRLISYLDDNPAGDDSSSRTASASPSRGESPPSTQSRNNHGVYPTDRFGGQMLNSATSQAAGRRGSNFWDSWSSIQGVASSLLGSGSGEGSSSASRKGSIKTPAWMKQDTKSKNAAATPRWGPQGKDAIEPKPGTIEERQALVQARKREALLLSCTQQNRDELGHFKRKASYDGGPNARSADPDLDEDALVYKHTVQSHDTMAGVTIKYSCQPETFRKVNRFWPNDNIQTRTYVLLPVDACTVRGRKVDDVASLELLNEKLNKVEIDSTQRQIPLKEQRILSGDASPAVTSPRQISKDEEEYKHDSFVILPSSAEPVEILRIPRRLLGYFPRARRKSNHNVAESITSTPKTSFDMLRHPPTHAAQQAAAALSHGSASPSSSLNASPVRPRGLSATRQRSSSTVTATNANSHNAWVLRGPGGVGKLRGLRTETSRPGPAEDALNQKFTQYFPGLAIQQDTDDTTKNNNNNNLLPRPRGPPTSRSPYRSTPRASIDSIRSTRSNSSTFGAGVAGVESFMRKLGKRPDTLPRSSSGNVVNAMGIPVGGDTGLGDLIELETNPDALHHDGDAARVERTPFDLDDDDNVTPTEAPKSEEELLNERFPIRGRITRAYRGDDG